MINSKLILRSLPLVASVLGRKYGVTVKVDGSDARTNGQEIMIPSLPLDCDERLIRMARAYIDHESSHIRFTDFDVIKGKKLDPLTKHIWNIFEDYRVEHLISNRYPGCRSNLNWLIEDIFAGLRPVPSLPAAEICEYILLTVRAWDVPAVNKNRDNTATYTEPLFPTLFYKLNKVLDQVKHGCQSTQDCMKYAEEVVTIIRDEIKDLDNKSGDSKSCNDSSDSSDKPGNSSTESQKDSGQDENNNSNPKQDQNHNKNSNNTESQTQNQPAPGQAENVDKKSGSPDNNESKSAADNARKKDSLEQLLNASDDELPDNIGERLADVLKANSERDTVDNGYRVATLSTKKTEPFDGDQIAEIKRISTALHSRLQGLLQSKVLKRRQPSRHGRLDTNRLYKINYNPKIFLRNQEKVGFNTAIHILLDCSGSMHKRIDLAGKACFAIANSLSKINGVSVGITVFPGDVESLSVAPLLQHGERVHHRFKMSTGGNTPLGSALWFVMQNLYVQKETRKIILIVTDGVPSSLPRALKAIQDCKNLGIELYGIGIKSVAIRDVLLPGSSEVINDINELVSTMFKLLQNALLKT